MAKEETSKDPGTEDCETVVTRDGTVIVDANTVVVGGAPAQALANLMIATSASMATEMHASVRASQHLDAVALATTTTCVAKLLGVRPGSLKALEDVINAAED